MRERNKMKNSWEKMYAKEKVKRMGNLTDGFMSLALANNMLETKNWLKGGKIQMETKSRYEVIAELEEKKRNYILSRDGLKNKLKLMERKLRDTRREYEDEQEAVKDFKEDIKEQEKTYDTLIKSVEESLNRFNKLQEKKK